MERQKVPKLVITFSTTTAAMAMESVCGPDLGRLIPIPREISAGCGLAWCAETSQNQILTGIMKKNNISYQEKQVIELFV